MFRKHTFLLLIISFLTILAISCDMESLSDPDMMAFYGEWESPIVYSGYSDIFHDYGTNSTITIDTDRMMKRTTRGFIKYKTEEEWSKDISSQPVALGPYYVKIFPTYHLEGYIELYDTKTFEKVSCFDYLFSEDHDTLTLKDDKTSTTYSRVTKEE